MLKGIKNQVGTTREKKIDCRSTKERPTLFKHTPHTTQTHGRGTRHREPPVAASLPWTKWAEPPRLRAPTRVKLATAKQGATSREPPKGCPQRAWVLRKVLAGATLHHYRPAVPRSGAAPANLVGLSLFFRNLRAGLTVLGLQVSIRVEALLELLLPFLGFTEPSMLRVLLLVLLLSKHLQPGSIRVTLLSFLPSMRVQLLSLLASISVQLL